MRSRDSTQCNESAHLTKATQNLSKCRQQEAGAPCAAPAGLCRSARGWPGTSSRRLPNRTPPARQHIPGTCAHSNNDNDHFRQVQETRGCFPLLLMVNGQIADARPENYTLLSYEKGPARERLYRPHFSASRNRYNADRPGKASREMRVENGARAQEKPVNEAAGRVSRRRYRLLGPHRLPAAQRRLSHKMRTNMNEHALPGPMHLAQLACGPCFAVCD